ncbi:MULTISPECIES: hypothetical protein [unclassified Paenibacillus]|uniref:hypothetical protein n=1 Tax=unclassified Paenibacillus TaxID=185978 RepID=UPI00178795CB|nr:MULTISPECIES: hypothetical protein [unclassified Paenibacillus]QOT11144.1 hypothetical protein JNUCC32_03660 [Paenibacillus sp. JNUCC-32]WFB56763.1 hypothetical protein P0X86_22585 [Paenibacillus sp. BR1-192]
MNPFNQSKKEIRTTFEIDLLRFAQAKEPTKPPRPWTAEVIIPASGCIACGWDADENLVLISSSGYSLTQAITGTVIHRDRDSDLTEDHMSGDHLSFRIPLSRQDISIFGFESGDGIHATNDGWMLEVIHPWWPRASVILDQVFVPNYEYLKQATMIDLNRLDGKIKCGFSPSGKHFVILGSGGALLYSRE